MNKEHWTKSAWAISIGTAIFSLLLTIIYDYSKDNPILTTVLKIFNWIRNLVWTFLNLDIKLWWIIASVFLIILIIVFFDKIKSEEKIKPDFYDYREGTFKRWRWTWSWNWNATKNAWTISDMEAHCPNCDTPMIDYSNRYKLNFDCPRCEFQATDNRCDEPHKIERIILDNISRQRAKEKNI